MLPENLLADITHFAFSDEDEWLIAFTEFLKILDEEEPTEEDIDEFESDYVFTRKHSVHKKTFVRLFIECFEEMYGREWSKDIITLEENFHSYFEILKLTEDSLLVKDLIMGDTLSVGYPSVDYKVKEGDIVSGKIFTWKGEHFFFGPMFLYETGDAQETVRAFTDVVKESYENATQSFLDYFGTNMIIFKDCTELEEKLNQFLAWFFRNRIPSGILKEDDTFTPVAFEEMSGKKEIGFIIDYSMGHMVIPEYGYALRLFSGKGEETPDCEKMAKKILHEEEIPSYFIKELIEKNPERSVELYSSFFPQIKTKEDVVNLFARCRRDWGRKPRRHGALFD